MKNITVSLKLYTYCICVFLSFISFSQTSPQIYTTAGTNSFTVPAGVNKITVQAWGGGGNGSTVTSNNRRGGGGGGGAFSSSTLNVTPGTTYTLVVGTGGASSATLRSSSFNTNWVVAAGGTNASSNSTTGANGGTAAASIGTIKWNGGTGANGAGTNSGGGGGGAGSTENGGNASGTSGGAGGNSNGGTGGEGVGENTHGNSGNNYGAGGSGGNKTNGSNRNGGSGANGRIVISWELESEIDVTGSNVSIIGDGSNTPTLTNSTNFGRVQIISETATRTYTIHNRGAVNLTISNINLVGTSDFNIINSPTLPLTIVPDSSTTFQVTFSTASIGTQTDEIQITSDDSDESLYRINIAAEGSKVFFDSDNDGVYDDVDLDDDNDGILDSIEENNCHLANGSSQASYKFLEETFGQGERTTINTSYDAVTTYCYEDGTVGVNTSDCPNASSRDLNDGKYTVYYKAADGDMVNDTPNEEVASWADQYWYTGGDHTGNHQGRMAMFNATPDPGIFYTAHISGALHNIPITYSFWVLNLDTTTAPGIATRLRPDIKVEFKDMDGNILINTATGLPAVITTGDIPPSINGDPLNSWHQFTASLTFNTNQFQVIFSNNEFGGLGNDLAIDDIEIRQTLCDMDGDGVADVFDLDSDNDGIPDVVEGNPTSASLSEGKATLTGVSSWIDANGNGVHDTLEGVLPINSDGDLIPDYLDLDSDNDGLFDVDEYGVISSSAPVGFQNGDGDVTGDGVGDGLETEAFREKDSDGNNITEYYGDGILDIYDFHHATSSQNYTNSYGNVSQGTGPLYALDSDGDGLPDYRDPYNDVTGIYDINTLEIYAHLPHTGGVLDSLEDNDGDGVMASRDGDDTVFGSPRNLDASYSLYFDGRNDYIEDENVISSGSATLMAFIKSDGNNTNNDNHVIAGQNDFFIRINHGSNTISAVVEGITLTSVSTISTGIWMHVTVSTTTGRTALYINGIEETSNTTGATISSTSNFMIGRATSSNNYFKGEIDEVRVFNTALTDTEIKRMVYQELDENNNFNQGKIIPLDISTSIGANLVKYYKMDAYNDDILDDKKTTAGDLTGAKIYNVKNIYFQRAPLPYVSSADGDWTNSASWLNGSEWDITSKQNNANDASIVHIKHNINLNGSYNIQGTAGLIVDSGKEFSIEADKGLYNSWYLKLDGLIDLDNESQLIQTEESILDVTSSGKLERDQQGTKDLYTYNYWCSPVGFSNTTSNNNSFRLIDNILKNGTIPASPKNITFLSSGYNGSVSGTNISIADYWIWKFANNTANTYYGWQHVRRTGTILAGQGFTMKGVEASASSFTSTQNYTFYGKPNNGEITLPLAADNEYFVGNPYPSAIDANEFILDNISIANGGRSATNTINGTLYFWDHFANSSHVLKAYEGGYATYTLTGSLPAISSDTRINATLTNGTKQPERYIPVGQGFFVAAGDGGNITFKNSQRIFKTEASDPSLFFKSTKNSSKFMNTDAYTDIRQKIRLKYSSPKGYYRLILAGVDDNATTAFDFGYDAPLIEDNEEDMFWVFSDNKYVIQGVDNFNLDQKLPLGIKTKQTGLISIKIDLLENISNNLNILLHDKTLNVYHDLKQAAYEVNLNAGQYLDRFEITFSDASTLNNTTIENRAIQAFFSKENGSIIIQNPNSQSIETTELFNLLGQSIFKLSNKTNDKFIEQKTNSIATGAYILKLKTETGIVSKKVLIE
ncbi:LamG-like jellyroll fold domain-containing protein [Mariniflexile sp.]|uniref:LamG-like jellyroll fold domain-containing protein n=1 Tax=Mariniflexile sp. TaxID=1979402 RepID=UPI00356823AA